MSDINTDAAALPSVFETVGEELAIFQQFNQSSCNLFAGYPEVMLDGPQTAEKALHLSNAAVVLAESYLAVCRDTLMKVESACAPYLTQSAAADEEDINALRMCVDTLRDGYANMIQLTAYARDGNQIVKAEMEDLKEIKKQIAEGRDGTMEMEKDTEETE